MRIPSGKTDQLIFFVALDATDRVTRKTGLSSFTVYRSRNGGTATVYTTPTVAELSSSNMPGVYALTIDEDTTIASGSDSEEYCVHITATGMAPVTRTIELYRRDVTSGQTAAVDSSGRVDVAKIAGTAQTARDIGGSVLVGDKTGFKLASDGLASVAAWTVAITGNITGNLSGSVGSVTGNVGGNVTGSVGSVSGVTFPTNFASLGIGAGGHILTVDTLTTYTGNTPQTGDSYARIGAAGAGLTALGDTRVAHLDADVSSRLAGTSYTSPLDAAGVRTAVGLAAANLDTQLATIDTDVNSRLAASGYTAPDNVSITAIKAKTDNLPSDPADESLVIAATTAIYNRIGAPAGLSVSADIAAVKADTGTALPADIAALSIPTAADIRSEIDTNSIKLDAAVSSRLATTDYSAAPSANDNADALLDRADAIETGVTLRQALRLKLAVLVGRLTGAGTGTEAFRNAVADDKPRVIATVDANGNRSAITTDAT